MGELHGRGGGGGLEVNALCIIIDVMPVDEWSAKYTRT